MIKKNQCQMVVILGILLIAPLFVASFESPKRAASDTLVGEQDAIGPLPIKPEDIPRATNAGYSSGGGTIETDASIDITAAVFSQAEDPASGITFTYRVGPSPLVLFGESSVYYLLGNQTLALTFPGCNLVMPEGTNPLQSVTSYFRGNDQAKWRGGLVDYGAIIYEDLYPGIDLVYKSTTQGLKYEFLVAPDADPGQILLAFANADFIEADECVLRVEVGGEVLEDRGLIALQENGVGTELVQCAFQQTCGALIQFTLGEYDVSVPLVIDPVVNIMEYSTLIGGPGIDKGYGIAVEDGFAYITGYAATGYPTTPGANDSSIGGTYDVFVTKLSVDGSALVYSTFIGGSSSDYGNSIAVERGCAYITGRTLSSGFPTTAGAFNTTHSGGNGDVFVTKVRADGCALIYSTFIGGAGDECAQSIAVDYGCAFVTGYTAKGGFDYPVTVGAYSTTHSGGVGFDVFVTKLSSNGSTLVYSTFLGGTFTDAGNGIVVEEGFAYVTGETASSEYPTTTGAYDTSHNGLTDAFVTKLSVDGSNLVYSTFLGAADYDVGEGIAVEDGCAFITGQTEDAAADYPTTQGAFDTTYNGDGSDVDAFVTKLSADGSDLMYSTFLGGSGIERGYAIAVENGFAYVTGESQNASTNFPTTIGAYNKTHSGGYDAFVTKLSTDGSTLVYSTFLGAADYDSGEGIAVEDGCAYITGQTKDAAFDYPTTVGAFNTTHNGNVDVFVTKLDTDADSDGMPDGWETTYGLNPAYNDASLDFDEDDLDNSEEYAQGTDPSNPDTDGDYMSDGWEVAHAFDPLTGEAKILLGYSTVLGGSGQDYGRAIAVEDGCTYITGITGSSGFPTTIGANDTSYNSNNDAFVTKISADGSALVYSTFIGGSNSESGLGIAVEDGCAYITGFTGSSGFPTTIGANDTSHNSNNDAFVTKISADGSALIYSTFLGGSGTDSGLEITVEDGYAYVVGFTGSSSFPITPGAYDTVFSNTEAFVTKISLDGSTLVYSTFLGGASTEEARGIAVEDGYAYVTGYTSSSGFPTTAGVFNRTHSGGRDVFATKLTPDGSALVYSTFLGGGLDDEGHGIAVEDDYAYITGYTDYSTVNFPVTTGAYDSTHNGVEDAFVTKLSPDGAYLVYSTFLGGTSNDEGQGIAVESGYAYITGYTSSSGFPTTSGAYDTTYNSNEDAFVTKLNVDGCALVFSTFLGSAMDDDGYSIAVENGYAYITGETQDSAVDFPTTAEAYDPTVNGLVDVFVTKLSMDVDRDDLPDTWEVLYSLDTTLNDASLDLDADSLNNSLECQLGTNPNVADTDHDGMPDGWEWTYSLSPRTNDATGDNDGDGLTNLQEYQGGTNPMDSDTDDDTMHDQWEVTNNLDPLFNDAASDADGDGLNNSQEYQHNTNPNLADSEGDGMPDGWEHVYSLSLLTNDAATDSDGDGLTNLQEYQLSTNPVDSDTDDDGITDGVEVASGTNPLNPASFPQEGNDSNLLLITYISLGVAVVSCILTVLLFVSFRRTNQKLVRDLETLNASIGKAEVPIPSKRDMDSSNAKDIKLPPVSGKSPVASPKDPHMDGKSKSSNTK